MFRSAVLIFAMACSLPAWSQMKPFLSLSGKPWDPAQLAAFSPLPLPVAEIAESLPIDAFGDFSSFPLRFDRPARIWRDSSTDLPIFIAGKATGGPRISSRSNALENTCFSYLEFYKNELRCRAPQESFSIREIRTDEKGWTHVRLQQIYKGVEVYGGEIRLHLREGEVEYLNGRYHPEPRIPVAAEPAISKERALERAWDALGYPEGPPVLKQGQAMLSGEQIARSELVVQVSRKGLSRERLAWHFELAPRLSERFRCFVDAQTGEVLEYYSLICRLGHPLPAGQGDGCESSGSGSSSSPVYSPPMADGPDSALARDLLGFVRRINNYRIGSANILLDVSRPMFNAARSQLPETFVGAIWTIDAGNKPDTEDLQLFQVVGQNNTWNNATAISAHYNAGRAYEYYYNTFKRNSINGKGGDIISIINIADDDGTPLGNAYWNGSAIFYGNGDNAFFPLARGLDVAGHEMTHGVIQNTANLEYYGEPGALNESFADIFGVMIDRDDFRVGEDVIKTSTFPSGAMRDLANPNNGGSGLNSPGWQPANTSEQYNGDKDNGGVHINSGIPNRAFFLFAAAVGKENAEQVYYYALNNYLTRSSRFIDCRLAVIESARILYGSNAAAAAGTAFDLVGITGSTGTAMPSDYNANAGQQYILAVGADSIGMFIYDLEGRQVGTLAATEKMLNKPSITDDGRVVLYVNSSKQIRFQVINWTTGQVQAGTLSSQGIWRNAVISKDARKVAAITDDRQPQIYVVDLLNPNKEKFFPLFNPTFTEGVQSGQVRFADALEWDLSGQYVVYDALNQVSLLGGSPYLYWDIGILHAWDNATGQLADGNIEKLITGLSEGESVGFPAFSKNSPDILAFDYVYDVDGNHIFTDADEFYLLGLDVQTGALNAIVENNTFCVPNYSVDDDYLLFNNEGNSGSTQVAFVQLKADKLSPAADPGIFLSNRMWASWFATGTRVLTSTKDRQGPESALRVFPNPFGENLQVRLDLPNAGPVHASLWDALGRCVWQKNDPDVPSGPFECTIQLPSLPAGTYLLRLDSTGNTWSRKLVKTK